MMGKDICHGSGQCIQQGSQTAIMPCWSLDRSIGMFIWSASVVTAKAPASYADDRHAIVSWNQSIEEFLKLKRSTIAYYIGDMVRKHKPTVTK